MFSSWLLECARTGRRVPTEKYDVDRLPELNDKECSMNVSRRTSNMDKTRTSSDDAELTCPPVSEHLRRTISNVERSSASNSKSDACQPAMIEAMHDDLSSFTKDGNTKTGGKNDRLSNQQAPASKLELRTPLTDETVCILKDTDKLTNLDIIDSGENVSHSKNIEVSVNANQQHQFAIPSNEKTPVSAVPLKTGKAPKAVLKNHTVEVLILYT